MQATQIVPIGQEVVCTAKAIRDAYNAALTEAGGSLPIWMILLALKRGCGRTQHEIAQAVGIESPTLTRHLDDLEAAGLVVRTRDRRDRRVIRVELTAAGATTYERLETAAGGFDQQVSMGLSANDLD